MPRVLKPRVVKPSRVSQAERNRMVEDNLDLAYAYVARMARDIPSGMTDDCIQEARRGLLRAAETFDADLGAFSTHAWYWMSSFVSRFLDQLEVDHLCPPRWVERWIDTRSCIWDDPGEDLDREDLYQMVLRQLARLPRRSQVILLGRARGETLQGLADRLGLSQERVRQLQIKATALLRRWCKVKAREAI